MLSETNSGANLVRQPGLPIHCPEVHWYAAYVRPRHEKRVAQQLDVRGVAHYLPVYDTISRWKDRRKLIQLPLFPGYIFVHISLQNRLDLLCIPSIVRLVGFNGAPVTLADEEVEGLRRALAEGVRAKPHPYLSIGRRVRITEGPLAGREGILKRWKGVLRVVLSIELLQRSILVDANASSVKAIPSGPSIALS